MAYIDTFRIKHHEDKDQVDLSIRESEHSIIEFSMTTEEWEELADKYRGGSDKTVDIKIPLAENVTRFMQLPGRPFRLLITEYDLKTGGRN